MNQIGLPGWALTTLEQARAHTLRSDESDDHALERLIVAATARIEAYCDRRLKSRAYVAASSSVVSPCVVTQGSKLVTSGALFGSVAEEQAVAGSGIPAGTVVEKRDTTSRAFLSEEATATGGAVSLTFSSPDTRLVLDGNGRDYIRSPEYPVTALSAAAYLDDVAAEKALDLANATFEEHGRIQLRRDVFHAGAGNIRLSLTAGYVPGRHQPSLSVLEECALELVSIHLQRYKNAIGMKESLSEGSTKTTFGIGAMPPHVLHMLAPYVRQEW